MSLEELGYQLTFLGKLTGRLSAKAAETLLTRILSPYTPEQARMLIDNGVSLVDLLEALAKEYKQGLHVRWRPSSRVAFASVLKGLMLARIAVARMPSLLNQLNTDALLERVQKIHPEFVSVFSTPEGKAWMQRNMNELKHLLVSGRRLYAEQECAEAVKHAD